MKLTLLDLKFYHDESGWGLEFKEGQFAGAISSWKGKRGINKLVRYRDELDEAIYKIDRYRRKNHST